MNSRCCRLVSDQLWMNPAPVSRRGGVAFKLGYPVSISWPFLWAEQSAGHTARGLKPRLLRRGWPVYKVVGILRAMQVVTDSKGELPKIHRSLIKGSWRSSADPKLDRASHLKGKRHAGPVLMNLV